MFEEKNPKILVVDENEQWRELVKKVAEVMGLEGVETASDVDEAISYIHKNASSIVVVFLDLSIPGRMSGFDFLEYLRKTMPRRVVPYVLTNLNVNWGLKAKVMEAGGFDAFEKWEANIGSTLLMYGLRSPVLKLLEQYTRDEMTGLLNYPTFVEMVASEMRATRDRPDIRHPEVFSLLSIDANSLKLINDTYGHFEGDRAIKTIALILRECVRSPSDHPCRRSGDEFLVWLPDADDWQAREVGGKLMQEVAANPFFSEKGTRIPLSVSIGTASVKREEIYEVSDALAELERKADASLYEAKTRRV